MNPETLIAQVFGLDPEAIDETTSSDTMEEWDSFGHMNLIMEIERIYGIALSTDDALSITDVASLKRVLVERGARW